MPNNYRSSQQNIAKLVRRSDWYEIKPKLSSTTEKKHEECWHGWCLDTHLKTVCPVFHFFPRIGPILSRELTKPSVNYSFESCKLPTAVVNTSLLTIYNTKPYNYPCGSCLLLAMQGLELVPFMLLEIISPNLYDPLNYIKFTNGNPMKNSIVFH